MLYFYDSEMGHKFPNTKPKSHSKVLILYFEVVTYNFILDQNVIYCLKSTF